MSKTLTMEFTGRSIPFLVTLTALCLSITVATSCRFLVVETGEAEPVAYGLFRLGETLEGQVCGTFRHYTAVINQANSKLPAQQPRTEGISSAQKAAQFGGIFSCILGFTATMLLFLSFFFQRFLSRCVWRIALPILLISAAVVQSITFSAFGDDACQSKCTSNTDAWQRCHLLLWRRSKSSVGGLCPILVHWNLYHFLSQTNYSSREISD